MNQRGVRSSLMPILAFMLFLSACSGRSSLQNTPAPPTNTSEALSILLATPTREPTPTEIIPSSTPEPSPTPGPSEFFRLRLNFSSSSDWSSLRPGSSIVVLEANIIDIQGVPFIQQGAQGALGLSQPLSEARAGTKVGFVAEMAFAMPAGSDQVSFLIERGCLGTTSLEVENRNLHTAYSVAEASWSDCQEGAQTLNIAAELLTREGPLTGYPQRILTPAIGASSVVPKLDTLASAWIRFTTSSDWSDLLASQSTRFLAAEALQTSGDPEAWSAGDGGLTLRQSLQTAKNGNQVSLLSNVLFSLGDPEGQISLSVESGALGWNKVEIFSQDPLAGEDVPATLNALIPAGTAYSFDPEPFLFEGQIQDLRPATERMVWAFYYPWYNMNDWNSSILLDKPQEPYASSSVEAMQRHIEQAKAAGIDGFLVSWWGPNDASDDRLAKLLELGAKEDFAIAIYFETLSGDGPRDIDAIRSWMKYLFANHVDHPGYFRHGNEPLIVFWASSTVPASDWRRVFSELEENDLHGTYLAMGANSNQLDVFDGLHIYGSASYVNLEALYGYLASTVRGFSLLDPHDPKIWAATVSPGYDEHLIPGRPGTIVERQTGEVYRGQWRAAMASDPDWIFITSWNEWWEHTHIEPSLKYGDLYMRITAEMSAEWKGKASQQTE